MMNTIVQSIIMFEQAVLCEAVFSLITFIVMAVLSRYKR